MKVLFHLCILPSPCLLKMSYVCFFFLDKGNKVAIKMYQSMLSITITHGATPGKFKKLPYPDPLAKFLLNSRESGFTGTLLF